MSELPDGPERDEIARCCQAIAAPSPSPFEISTWDWWDGFVSGIARCRTCGRTYYFDLLADDAESGTRIFGFASISASDHARILEVQTRSGVSTQQRADEQTLRIRDALAPFVERRLVVAASRLDVEVLAAKLVELSDWKRLLGPDMTNESRAGSGPEVPDLLQQLLTEECTPFVRDLLEKALAATGRARHLFELNRFDVEIDHETGVVTIQDVLETSAEGTCRLTVDELAVALQRCPAW